VPDLVPDHQRVTEYLTYGELASLLRRSLKYVFRPRPKVRIVQEPPPGQPLVSVIIPTYNRSNVLRIAIQSVLWQTVQDFELLVVGDGCTDDSESVVNSFADARIQWRNLPANSGHQSAPVNVALALFRGRYVAFLGHDDIWHPDHLRTQLRTIASSAASVAVSVMQMRGPKHQHFRLVTGIFPGGVYDPVKCTSPSGLMIAREVYERVGPWNDYRTVWRNPDCEFQYQAYLAEFRYVSTGELTAFKFPSVLWRSPYTEQPCAEQNIYFERIQRERWFLLKETLAIAWVHLWRLPMYGIIVPPPPDPHTPGWAVSYYRKIRGLEKEAK
jgi:glycosyltransferase involved in cell wall biosynthesis